MSQNVENNTVETNTEITSNPKVWKFNNFEVEFDITDVDIAEKYEKTFEIMGEKEKQLPKTGKQSELLKAQFKWFSETFDLLFGEGSGEKIFNGKKSVSLGFDAYESFLAFIKSQKTDLFNKGQRIHSTYSNRAQRRAEAKGKK